MKNKSAKIINNIDSIKEQEQVNERLLEVFGSIWNIQVELNKTTY